MNASPSIVVDPTEARDKARSAMAAARLRLPDDATDIMVDLSGYQDFRNVALTRFTAPRASVISMCETSPGWLKKYFTLADYQKDLLGGVTPATADQLCVTNDENGRGISANVLIPVDDPANVRVAIFELPVH